MVFFKCMKCMFYRGFNKRYLNKEGKKMWKYGLIWVVGIMINVVLVVGLGGMVWYKVLSVMNNLMVFK